MTEQSPLQSHSPEIVPKLAEYDCIVLGAGLTGLLTAIHQRKNGKRVLLLEKKNAPGGLCNTFDLDGQEFLIASYDFNETLIHQLKKLNIPIRFKKLKTLILIHTTPFRFPQPLLFWFKLLFKPLDFICYSKLFVLNRNSKSTVTPIDYFASKFKTPALAELVRSFSFFAGKPPARVPIQFLQKNQTKEFNLGIYPSYIIEGNPSELIEQLVLRFIEMGGEIKLNSHGLQVSSVGKKQVMTDAGIYTASDVIPCFEHNDHFPDAERPTLAFGIVHLIVTNNFILSKQADRVIFLPPNISDWMNQLYQGKLPRHFGFHLFEFDSDSHKNYKKLNLYFYLPKGMNALNENQSKMILNYIFSQLNYNFKEFKNQLLYHKFLSPDEFSATHSLSSHIRTHSAAPDLNAGPTIKKQRYSSETPKTVPSETTSTASKPHIRIG